jgi:ABC-type multidrug transport system fused ATPase/permease subunit
MRALPVADPGTPELRSAWRFIGWLMVRQRASVLLGILWGCGWMIAQALVPAAIGAAVDALAARNTGAFTLDCLAVLGLGAATAVTGVLRHRRVVANFLDAAYRIIQLISAQAATLGNTLARLLSTGEVISVGTADVEAVGGAIDVTGRGSGAIAALVVVAVILLSRSVPLGLVVLIGGPAMTALVGALLRPLHRRQQAYRGLQGELASRAADIVAGLRVLRGIGGEAAFSARYREQSQDLRHTGVHVARTESFLFSAEILLPGMFVTAATWIAAHYALQRLITPGQLVTFYAYTSFLALPLATLTEAADKMVRGHVGAGRVIAILRLRPDIADPASPAPEPGPGAALHDPLSGLTATAGEFIGLAAADPDEAAELADRIGRYLPGQPGADQPGGPVFGGVPVADLPVATVRSRILVAANDAHLFAGRLDEQLAGARPASERTTLKALSAASAHDVVEALPGGLAGHLAARGRTLSGGQAQRLRLARALLADPEVLVLVEPTSAVDAHTEARIATGLREARRNRTTVVISNSPLLLDLADRVLFLRDGRVDAQGTHAELLAASPAYASAVTRGEP